MTYEAAFAIAAVFISVLVAVTFLIQNRVSNYPGRLFFVLVTDNGLTALSVSILWAVRTISGSAPLWLAELMELVYFSTHLLLILFMFMYIFGTVRIWRELSGWIKVAILAPAGVLMCVILSNPLTHLIYTIDADGEYHRGQYLSLIYLGFAYYLALIFFVLIWYRKSFSARRRLIIIITLALGVLSNLVQLLVPELKVEVVSAAICALILFLFIQNPSEQVDPELDMLSNAAFHERMKYNLLARKRFDVVELILPDYTEYERRHSEEQAEALLKSIGAYLSSLASNVELYRIDKNSFAMEVIRPLAGEVGGMLREIQKRFSESWTIDGEDTTQSVRLLRVICPSEITDDNVLLGVMNRFALSRSETRVMMTSDFDLDSIKRNREINAALSRAMEKNNFEMRYTPVYSQALERIVAAEVSLRFFDDELGYVYDDELFRFAERSGHVLQLGELIFEEACRMIKEERLEEQGLSFLAVRLHPAMCLQYRLMDRLREIMEKSDIDPKMLCLMLSEYTVSTATAGFKASIAELEGTGIRFCLEDYGSGFTSITSIFEMPFSVLKINHSVLRAAIGNEKARITMDSTLSMARELNMMTMVEGIDDENYFRMIRDMACDLAKGNYFYEQVVAEEFLKVIHLKAAEGGTAE